MKTLKLIALAAFVLLFSQCKSTAPTAPSGPAPSLIEVVNILDSAERILRYAAEVSNGDPYHAIEMTSGYLAEMKGVKDVYTTDSTYIHIILNSGLETTFWLDRKDSAGNSIFRGGAGGDELTSFSPNTTLSKRTISNKKVLFFAADTKSLPAIEPQLQKSIARINSSDLGLNVTVLRNEQCSYPIVETFKDYGLVIMDTHGEKDAFMTGSKITFPPTTLLTEETLRAMVTAQVDPNAFTKMLSGELRLGKSLSIITSQPDWYKDSKQPVTLHVEFTSRYLNHLPAMPNTVLFGNMCYSGWTNTNVIRPRSYSFDGAGNIIHINQETTIQVDAIAVAFLNRNPISYYGYTREDPAGTSRPVRDEFAADMENSFLKRLVTDRDSTRDANRSNVSNTEFYDPESRQEGLFGDLFFRHYGGDDYSYFRCGDSFTDDRDGQKYKAVCIGKQTWMAQNLNYNAPGSLCYDDNITKCDTFGRLYDRKTVMQGAAGSNASPSGVRGVCPNGWHLPSYDEFTTMINALGGERIAGEAMKSLKTWVDVGSYPGTNSSGFNGLAAGIGLLNSKGEHEYQWTGIRTYFWNTVPQDISTKSYAPIYVLDFNAKDILKASASDEYFVSCRCVKDK